MSTSEVNGHDATGSPGAKMVDLNALAKDVASSSTTVRIARLHDLADQLAQQRAYCLPLLDLLATMD